MVPSVRSDVGEVEDADPRVISLGSGVERIDVSLDPDVEIDDPRS